MVGEVIKMRKEDLVPCDVLVIKTSDIENRAFVETKGLDGETNLKQKQTFLANRPGRQVINDDTYKRSFEMEYSPPNRYFASF
jgi:phospholipid-translocating ATPase